MDTFEYIRVICSTSHAYQYRMNQFKSQLLMICETQWPPTNISQTGVGRCGAPMRIVRACVRACVRASTSVPTSVRRLCISCMVPSQFCSRLRVFGISVCRLGTSTHKWPLLASPPPAPPPSLPHYPSPLPSSSLVIIIPGCPRSPTGGSRGVAGASWGSLGFSGG